MVELRQRTKQPGVAGRPATTYEFGDGYRLDLGRGCLRRADKELKLRPKAFDVLTLFVENCGRLLSKSEIMAAVWPGIFVSDDSLTQCVREIRRAIGDSGHVAIRNSPGRGYLFDLPVTARRDEPAPGPPADAQLQWQRMLLDLEDKALPALAGLAVACALEILKSWRLQPGSVEGLPELELAVRQALGMEPRPT